MTINREAMPYRRDADVFFSNNNVFLLHELYSLQLANYNIYLFLLKTLFCNQFCIFFYTRNMDFKLSETNHGNNCLLKYPNI